MINKERLIESFVEMVKIYSPSKKEKEIAQYLIKELEKLEAEIYLDESFEKYNGNAPTIIAKIQGNIEGNGVTLAAHMDVIEPCNEINPIIDEKNEIIKTNGLTTLGADDKAGIASILETIKVIKERKLKHKDIYIVLTPGEEVGMLGAKSINWENIPKNMKPALNMIVIDNVGRAGIIAHTAPSKFDLSITFIGRKAHAGIEPEKGINAINMAAMAISKMKMGRIDELTTSNIGVIESNFPTNVVADKCVVKAEVRGHSEERILEVIKKYKDCCDETIRVMGGDYEFSSECDYPSLKPKDNLEFAREFSKVYEELGIKSELKIIGGGSDSNIFAKNGYNSVIIGIGMNDVHTVNEVLELKELYKTTQALINYIAK